MTAQIADRFSIDNVFLIGDSAHRFPPTGGLGLNSGAGDVHNLVWKLAATLKNQAPADLLASYELERKPVAQRNCDTSVNNFQKMSEVTDVLGLDTSKAHIPARFRSSALAKLLPDRLIDALLKFLTWPIARKVEAAYAETSVGQATRARLQAAINNQVEHFDMLGAELGYVYRDGCAVDAKARMTPDNTVRDYTPVASAGARLPHVAFEKDGDTLTTLDVISYDRYTLFTNGPATNAPDTTATFGLPCHSFDIQKTSRPRALATAFNLPTGGWLLVRPDGHVADRS
jgi:2,4-dichlorophenol 6-monooxygenase